MINNPTELTQKWEFYLIDRGLPERLISQYLDYIQILTKQKLPVIFEVEHLAAHIGVEYIELLKMINNPISFYRDFQIPKRSGGKRTISAPYPSLLLCQDWIYEHILKKAKLHHCSHAYRPKKSIISNAKEHLSTKALLKMDMKNFVPSISINWVINYFSKLGYSNNVAYVLASLCCLNEGLPQGASTSPALSNILLKHLDSRLYKLSKKYEVNYTRYADDLAFSGNYIPHKYIDIVSSIITDFGLLVNTNKTQLIVGDKQKIVTGISVKGQNLALPRQTKRAIKQELHYIKKFGLLSHISKLKIKNPYYSQSLEGKLRFWLQIEPDDEFAKSSLDFLISLN
jgi:RNA-directed DNA polymerase